MLISTSRKPSSQTRRFCKSLSHVFDFQYINRGKMNMRDLLIKSIELEEDNIAIINQIKGNPSKITFFSQNGEELLTLLINVILEDARLNFNSQELKLISKVDELDILSEILNIDLVPTAQENYIMISSEKENYIAKINFIDKLGNKTNLQIFIKRIL